MRLRELGDGRDDRGAVAAEFAVTLPAIAMVIVLAVGALSAGAQHVRLQDAAADAARLAARGESAARVDAVLAAADGATGTIERDADQLVCVRATSSVAFGLDLAARACALDGGW